MAKVSASIVNTLKKYVRELEKNNIHVRSAYLFGSYAKGEQHEWSDLDIALISDDFKGVRFFDRQKIARVTIDVDYRISPFPYKTENFTQDDLFVKEILETGIKIV